MFDLDSLCGATFTYRDLLECSKAWKDAALAGRPIDNVPREKSTFDALRVLAEEVLDPIAATLGRPTISYGFAGPQLTKHVSGQIAPRLDQHAAHERKGAAFICQRLGAAVDFLVPGYAAHEVARWIFDHRRFDRIYVYGDARPIHVSVGPEHTRAVFELRRTPAGHQVPYRLPWRG